jgi:hypothetical protein
VKSNRLLFTKTLVCSIEDMTQEEEVIVVDRANNGIAREIQRGI